MSLKNYIKAIGLGVTVLSLSACITGFEQTAEEETQERVCDTCDKTSGGTAYIPTDPVDIEPDPDLVVQCYGYKWKQMNGTIGKQHYPTASACMTSQNQTAVSHEITSSCSLKSPCSSF